MDGRENKNKTIINPKTTNMRAKLLQLIAVIALFMSAMFNLSARTMTNDTQMRMKAKVAEITRDCHSDYGKAWAIYKWIILNVEYDDEMWEDHQAIIESMGELDLPMATKQAMIDNYQKRWNNINLNDGLSVFEKRKGICSSISHLYKLMCEEAGLECKIVIGVHVHSWFYAIGHAWNIVKIDGKKYLVDVTNGIEDPWESFNIDPKERLQDGFLPLRSEDQCIPLPHSYSRCAWHIVRDVPKGIKHTCSLIIVKKMTNTKKFFRDIKCTF